MHFDVPPVVVRRFDRFSRGGQLMTGRLSTVRTRTRPDADGRPDTRRRVLARRAAIAVCVAAIGSGALSACSSESKPTAAPTTTVTPTTTAAPTSTLPEVVSDTTLPGGETSGKTRAPAPANAQEATAATTPPPANPQPNSQVQVEISPDFPKSIPLPQGEQAQANTAPLGAPPESSASLVVGQDVPTAVANYESQLKSSNWKVTSKVVNPEFGELKATRKDAQLTAIFAPGDTRSKTVIQISVKGDAG